MTDQKPINPFTSRAKALEGVLVRETRPEVFAMILREMWAEEARERADAEEEALRNAQAKAEAEVRWVRKRAAPYADRYSLRQAIFARFKKAIAYLHQA